MKKWLKKIINADEYLVGINQRNLGLVYPYNPRKHFPLANDKVLSKSILEKNDIPTPRTYAVISGLWEINEQLEEINNNKEIVIKPANGSGGGGILILFKHEDGNWYNHADELYTREKLAHHIAKIIYGVYSIGDKDQAIIEYCIKPHKFLTSIYNKGIPDFRVIVFNNIPITAMLRVPTDKSDGKANLHQGAMGIGVDLEKGILMQGFYKNKYLNTHPDSGFKFVGTTIPNWQETIDISIETSKLFPLMYLGIDIIFDKNRGPMVIEVNARPGLQIQNINKTGLKTTLHEKTQYSND